MKHRLKFAALSCYEQNKLESYYLRYHSDVIPQITYTDFCEFEKTGMRIRYEEKYFNRRRRLNSTFMMYIVFGEKYLSELCDLIWAVCDEFTWALPAHTAPSRDAYKNIDLFNAETAMCLTELSYILDKELPTYITERISYEVNRRVITPYENNYFIWEKANHNWAAVCGGCIGMIYLYKHKPVPQRIFDTLNCYISGFNSDGVCLEGLGYWSYGFGYYMYFAELLKRFTGQDIAADDKIHEIAKFQQNMYLGTEAINCSDCCADSAPLMGLTGLLCEYFKGEVFAPPVHPERNDDCGRWANYIRSYIYKINPSRSCSDEMLYPFSQWYIKRTKSYGIFVKGGHNAEPHNHNDIGSFILSDNCGQIICDLGCGEYTNDYFDPQKRYNYLCNSSLGHNVPIIDNCPQMQGYSFCCSKFLKEDNLLRLEIGNAYNKNVHISRCFELLENGINLYDEFGFDDNKPHSITERFVSRLMPIIRDGKTHIGPLSINGEGQILKKAFSEHDGRKTVIYLIDFVLNSNKFKGEFRL